MENVSTRLRDLRMQASPRLSVRAMAAALDLPLGTYSNYESARYKKATLPLDLTRRIAAVLTQHKVDPAEVMKLAGLSDEEAEPEAKVIEQSIPAAQYVSVSMLFPSEAALTDMIESLLSIVPPDASRREAAQILARLLPAGFAAIGPVAPDKAAEHPPFPIAPPPFDPKSAETKPA